MSALRGKTGSLESNAPMNVILQGVLQPALSQLKSIIITGLRYNEKKDSAFENSGPRMSKPR